MLLVVFMAWKMRRYLLCSCCLEETNKMPDVEANDLLTMAQAVQSSQGNAPGAQETPQ